MKPGNSNFLDRLIERLGRLDPANVQSYVLRLVREKGFLETVFNTIKEGIILIEHGLKIQYTNHAACRLLGLPDDCTGQRLDRFLREVAWSRIMDADSDEWHRMSLQEIEVFYPAHRFLTFYLVPYKADAPGGQAIPMAILILHDVTEVHADAQKTIESKKVEAITMLAAGVAHEIGNPLNSLTIHLQLLQRNLAQSREAKLAEEAGSLVDVALQEVGRLDAIVNNFLRAVRPAQPTMERIAIQAVLTETLGFMRPEIENRGVLVEATWPDGLPPIMGDAGQLKQAFYNIIRNSTQAMPDGGALRITAAEQGNFLEVRIADSGRGISQQDFPQILEPYFTTRADGTGLGLLIVDRIVRSHGGELGIESVAGAGTVFTVRLPLHERQVRLLQASTAGADGETADTVP